MELETGSYYSEYGRMLGTFLLHYWWVVVRESQSQSHAHVVVYGWGRLNTTTGGVSCSW